MLDLSPRGVTGGTREDRASVRPHYECQGIVNRRRGPACDVVAGVLHDGDPLASAPLYEAVPLCVISVRQFDKIITMVYDW